MVDQIIDKRTVAIPGPIGDVTPQAQALHDETKAWRDQTEAFAGSTVALQDQAVSSLVLDPSSKTYDALAHGGRKTMVVFGDSMTVSASATARNWEYLVGAQLGLTVRNYGVGGMGFITGATPYAAQLANAKADSSYNHERDVRYVVVNGSTNDIYNNLDDMATAINSFAAAVKQEYPNAEYIGISGLCGANVRWTDRDNNHRMQEAWPTFATTAATLLANGFHVIGGAEFWLLYNFDATQSDGLHPNDAGHRLIANNVLSELAGIHPSPYTAEYKPSSRTSFTANKLTLPVVSATNDYYVWKPDPMNRQYSISGNMVSVVLDADQIQRFGINPSKDANGNVTGIYGIDVPIAKKLFPVTRMSVHPLMDSMPNSLIYINNTLLIGGQPNYLTYRKTDSRLDNPGDANEFLYAHVASTMIPSSDYSKPYFYNLLGQQSITVRADFSATFPVLGRFVG
jgi:lysophospholipase L1-like esterase